MITSAVFASAAVSVVAAVLALLSNKSAQVGKIIACVGGLAASILAFVGAGSALLNPSAVSTFAVDSPFPFAHFILRFDALNCFLVLVIAILSCAVWIYSLSYMDEYESHGLGKMGFFLNMFIVSMQGVILVDNAFWFLVFFELMSLASYFLVVAEETPDSIKAGLLYLVIAHVGMVLIMIGYLLMASRTGSLDYSSFRSTDFGPVLSGLVFMLGFLGFGMKAGIIPFHSWLPLAHPAAPSNVSCLMSGGMIKIGIFGIIKVGLDLLQSSQIPLWWGLVVLLFGAVSSVLGVIYALVEHDLKKLLAYHSVENIGIILMGVGVGFVGVAINQPVLSVLGMMAGLFHLINHAVFKGLLFLGAGSVMFSAHTKDMDLLGGLEHRMPVTAVCFLIGALAISAIPPLNGFMSEWFTYQGLINVAGQGDVLLSVVTILTVVALTITGALAVTCFVKAFGITFAGRARSEHAEHAKEVPAPMQLGTILLAALCVVLGLGAFWVAPLLEGVAASIGHVGGGIAVLPAVAASSPLAGNVFDLNGTQVSSLLLACVLLALFVIVLLVKKIFGRGGTALRSGAWMTGYEFNSRMPVQATTFAANLKHFYAPLYKVRSAIAGTKTAFLKAFSGTVAFERSIEPMPDKGLVDAPSKAVERFSEKIRVIAHGNFRIYCLYIVAVLALFLVLAITLVR